MPGIEIRPLAESDRTWARELIINSWGSEIVVLHGAVFHPAELEGFIAYQVDDRAGLATYQISRETCELVTLNALIQGAGIGTQLVQAVRAAARQKKCSRLMLVTTNDNTSALRFYQKLGFRLSALRVGAVDAARSIKPQIPLVGNDGIPIRDELELELML
jgi:ribosomal protein S18 acetylase RimI-like enzyme